MRKSKQLITKLSINKFQYELDRQTAKILALPSRNVSKYGFLISKHVVLKIDLIEKKTTMKRFEYLPLGKTQKYKKKQYQKLDDTFEYYKICEKEKSTLENYSKSNLIYNATHSFYKHCVKYCNLT